MEGAFVGFNVSVEFIFERDVEMRESGSVWSETMATQTWKQIQILTIKGKKSKVKE